MYFCLFCIQTSALGLVSIIKNHTVVLKAFQYSLVFQLSSFLWSTNISVTDFFYLFCSY